MRRHTRMEPEGSPPSKRSARILLHRSLLGLGSMPFGYRWPCRQIPWRTKSSPTLGPTTWKSFRFVSASVLTLRPAEERKCRELLRAHRREMLAAEFARRQCDLVGIQECRSREATLRHVGEYLMVTGASRASCAMAARAGAATGIGGYELGVRRRLNVVAGDVVVLSTEPSL
jgi:hypothetical protein